MRQSLWWYAAAVCGGIDGLSAVTTTDENGAMTAETRGRLTQIRRDVESLDDEYLLALITKTRTFGTIEGPQTTITAYPELVREIWYCLKAGWWRSRAPAETSDDPGDGEDENETEGEGDGE